MELPNWVVDEVLIAAKPTAFRLAVMLYRHGSPRVGGAGERRAYWRGSLQQLARLTGARKQALIEAERELALAGLLTVHRAIRPNSGHAISAPFDRPGGTNFVPPSELETLPHGDERERGPDLTDDRDLTTTTPGDAVRISDRLAELRVSRPASWIARFGAERCDVALEILAANRRRGYEPRNPAGFLYTLLTSSQPLERPEKPHDAAIPRTFEDRREKYVGGTWGHLGKHW